MTFAIGKVQMKFLHLLSTEAMQSMTVHCLNDPSLGTTAPQTQRAPLQFKGWNGQIFEMDTLLEPYVLSDECEVGLGGEDAVGGNPGIRSCGFPFLQYN